MGFSFVEVGTVTPKPQGGKAEPREFRLMEDKALINRYEHNSDGHDIVYHRLKSRNMKFDCSETESDVDQTDEWKSGNVLNRRRHFKRKENDIVGVNIGKNKMSVSPTDDYIHGVRKFGRLADFLVVNILDSNLPGHRDMLKREELITLLHKVVDERDNLMGSPKPAVLVKVSPDLSDEHKRDIADVVTRPECKVDGLIVCGTTVSRPDTLRSKYKRQPGGLSGEPLKQKSLKTIRDMYKLTQGQIPIIGVGGISCGLDAYMKVRAGASLVQVYTALEYHGPPIVDKIKKEMSELLRHDGFSHISEAVGADMKGQDKENGLT